METIIGRISEQKLLLQLLQSTDSELVAVYGRRRVGKTFLIRNVYEKQLVFEFSGTHNASLKKQLAHFAQALSHKAKLPLSTPESWTQAFDQLTAWLIPKIKKQKKVIFIDEFPWLHTPKSGFREAFEQFWNMWASKQKNLIVVICGSAAAWMIKNIVNNRGGLHNRVTRKIRLLPFTLKETEAFLQSRHIHLDRYQLLQLYMVMGGVPQYLKMINPGESVAMAIDQICFSKDGFLRDEFKNLFHSLFQHANDHVNIIKALAKKSKGLTRNEIIKDCKLKTGGGTTQLLDELRESGFIDHYIPFGKTSKDTLYKLVDEYTMFYLKFMLTEKIQGSGSWIMFSNGPSWNSWAGIAFENICLKHIQPIKNALGIASVQTEQYAWRTPISKSDSETGAQIDLIIDRMDHCINVCEMKFTRAEFEITSKYAQELQNKLVQFQSHSKTRKTLFLTFITTLGIKNISQYQSLVPCNLSMDALFE